MSKFKQVEDLNEGIGEVEFLRNKIESLEKELAAYRSTKKPEDEIIAVEISRIRDQVLANDEGLNSADLKKFEV